MKKLYSIAQKKGLVFWGKTLMMFAVAMSVAIPVHAVEMPSFVGAVLGIVAGALQILGAAVGVLGAMQFALSFKNDDADAKAKGMRAFLAGAGAYAVSAVGRAFLQEAMP